MTYIKTYIYIYIYIYILLLLLLLFKHTRTHIESHYLQLYQFITPRTKEDITKVDTYILGAF